MYVLLVSTAPVYVNFGSQVQLVEFNLTFSFWKAQNDSFVSNGDLDTANIGHGRFAWGSSEIRRECQAHMILSHNLIPWAV